MKELAGFLGVAVTHPVFIGVGVVIACAGLAGKLDDWLNKETKDAVASIPFTSLCTSSWRPRCIRSE